MSYIDNIVKFHTFSKSTVRENLTLGEAVNPSGHTVTAKQIRTQDIPAFIYSFMTSETDALTWAEGNIDAHVRHNDILYYGSDFKMGFGAPKCLIRVAKTEVDGKLVDLPKEQHSWEPFNIQEATQLANSEGDNVINIHKNCKIAYVHTDNNAAVNSNKFAAFVKTADDRILDHFIAATDQIIGGQPSLGYTLLLFKDGQTKALLENEETGKDNYIANPFAGIIHFMDERTELYDAAKNYEVSGFSVYCYEYIGDKLDSMLTGSTTELLDEHTNDSTIHVTGNDKLRWDKAEGLLDEHIIDSTMHVTSNDKLRWNEAEELLVEHINDDNKHITKEDREKWDKGGNLTISGDNFINPEKTDAGWNLTLNNSNDISSSDTNEDKKFPTVNAVKRYVDNSLVNPTMYLFPDLPKEDREYYMIFDAWQNPVYISEKFKKELTTGDRLFDYRSWEKFHIDMPYLETQSERMFHNNLNLMSFKSDLSSLTRYTGFFHGDNKLQYVDIILTDKPLTDGSNCFTSCNKLKYVKLTGNNPETINTFLSYMPMNANVKNKKLIIGKNENGKFVKYEKTDIPGDRLNSLIEAGWIFNN